MNTEPAAEAPEADRVLHLSELVRRPITDAAGESIGRLDDVVVRLRGTEHPLVIGVVAGVGGKEILVPLEQVSSFDGESLKLISARLDLRQFERRPGEVLLRADVLGHRLIDVPTAHLIRAADLELRRVGSEWVLAGVDTHRRPGGLLKLLVPTGAGWHQFEDWANFEPLIGHASSALLRGPFGRIRKLKPAQIADLLEEASKAEETEILGQVHADPELEADVFEELDEDLATRLLGARTDAEIAEVIGRMRQPVLDLLPVSQRTKVLTLMGFNPTSAGGLMGMDFVAVPADSSVRDALGTVASSRNLAPEALTSVHAVDE